MTTFGPVLTFKTGYFEFENPLFTNRLILDRNPAWLKQRTGLYATTDLKAAAEFRRHSDETAERVFNRAFNKLYASPLSLPLLFDDSLSFLDSHQQAGIRWILTRARAYLAHAPGAGKTAEAVIASLLCTEPGQTVFIVPPSLTKNWEREIAKFSEWQDEWYSVAVVPLSNRRDEMAWTADFIIVPDSLLTRTWVYEKLKKMKIKLLAVDEASRFKEPTSERTKALFGGRSGAVVYTGIAQRARHLVLLDGSPMPNRPMELWAPVYACDPEAIECMSQNDFGFHYCGATLNDRGVWEFRHASNEQELHERLTERFMHVVKESDLAHPERRRSLLYMDQDVRTPEHKTWERKHLREALAGGALDEKLNQGELARYRQELGRHKVKWVGRYVSERLHSSKEESILLFAWHRDVCQMLAGYLQNYKPGLVMGGVSNDDRERIFADFQSGKQRIIIGNIAAMGRGHNLQRADRVIFCEYSWTDELNKQCEKRASRRGRDTASVVRCEYVVAPNSMDEPVLNALFTKQKRVERIIG